MDWSGDAIAMVTVVNANVVPKGTDPTGQLSYGEIILRGMCLHGKIITEETSDPLIGSC
jgi:hypothetical protein